MYSIWSISVELCKVIQVGFVTSVELPKLSSDSK